MKEIINSIGSNVVPHPDISIAGGELSVGEQFRNLHPFAKGPFSGDGGRSRWSDFNTSRDDLTEAFPEGLPEGGDAPTGGLFRHTADSEEYRSPARQRLDILRGDLPGQRPAGIADHDTLGGTTTSISGGRRDGTLTRSNQKATGRTK